jgi:hypothetical protein
MNKNLDHLFEQARKSMQSEMPLEEVQQLIHGQASPSLWTNQKIWIMSTSILGILTIGIICWFNSYNHPTPTTATTIPKENPSFAQQAKSSEQHTIVLQDAAPDNIPLPILNKENIEPNALTLASFEHNNPKTNSVAKKASKLDSLGPKKTFTEYKLEIKKENSEQEIKKLKAELSNYGIHMEVKILNYDTDNKIKRFKGQFKTDSLFCGSTMNDYEFDISGAFKSMEFIFRVADNKNLKYLKIQSDNFEETIECYDDEVISSSQEARKISRQMHEEMARTHEQMANAQIQMANAQQEIARAQEEMALLKKEEYTKHDIKRLEHLDLVNWDKIEADIEKAMENVEIELGGVNKDLTKALKDMEVIILDKNFKEDLKVLQKDLAKMRLDIEQEVTGELIEHRRTRTKETRYEFSTEENGVPIIEGQIKASRLEVEGKEQTAQELKEEATAMEEAAKELKRFAKEKRKMAKKKTKNK